MAKKKRVVNVHWNTRKKPTARHECTKKKTMGVLPRSTHRISLVKYCASRICINQNTPCVRDVTVCSIISYFCVFVTSFKNIVQIESSAELPDFRAGILWARRLRLRPRSDELELEADELEELELLEAGGPFFGFLLLESSFLDLG